ncbi:MAG TPA: two-component regulator propeller domain-containing protein, partial [Thermoanaerobaculia bacterium]|nr:two-component regulator propeller domain-containing protein [Thermoanaerobaculia bacterium]
MYRGVVAGLLVSLLAGPALRAELLPLRLYTAADGLAGDFIQSLAEDPRGFLWIGTSTGVSRFDGYTFASYGTEDGLPHPSANALLIASDGMIWVGTSQGLAHSIREPVSGRPLFETLGLGDSSADHVLALAEGAAGRIWVGTTGGLLAVDRAGAKFRVRREPLGVNGLQGPAAQNRQAEVYSLLADTASGRLWAG